MNFLLVLIIILAIVVNSAKCARILGVFPMPSRSHYILGNTLMKGLAEKGHDVTVINPYGENNPPKNGSYTDILLTGFLEVSKDSNINLLELEDMSAVIFYIFMNFMGNDLSEKTLSHPNVQKLLNSNEKFDVVILEQFVNDAMKGFAHHFKAPLILFSTFASNAWVNPLVANPAPPSYISEQNIEFSYKNFFHRLRNFVNYVMGELNRNIIFFPAQDKIMKKYIPGVPDLSVLNYNASLVLLNSHISTNQAVPRVPCMIDIGGYHIQPPKKLPEDLQKFLDHSTEGVIYFSMGSNLKSINFPPQKREALLKAFSKLKVKVLWKWEEDTLPGQPSNVKLSKWLPQQEVLSHPNVKLFITHGGLLSVIESVYHGVPILAIPVFGDQKTNADTAVRGGYGLILPYSDITENSLLEKINELLNNKKYTENIKRRSRVMHDRQNSPMDTADYWIQYVIRHNGAPHLKVQGLDLPWYQYLSLDVAAFIAASSLLVIYLFYLVFKIIFNKLCSKKGNKEKKS